MTPSAVARTLQLIPERTIRTQSGSNFDPAKGASGEHAERVTHLATFLGWLSPLNPITREDMRRFGLLTAYGRPAVSAAGEEEADDLLEEADDVLDEEDTLELYDEPTSPSLSEPSAPMVAPPAA